MTMGIGEMGKVGRTKTWRVQGHSCIWSVWDFGDELTIHEGPALTDHVYARVPEEVARRMDDGGRRMHVECATGAIHVAKLLGSDSPQLRLLWR
jgi:hypothetical protein